MEKQTPDLASGSPARLSLLMGTTDDADGERQEQTRINRAIRVQQG
jgi:hypothetical protein